MSADLAIIAGKGALPELLLDAAPGAVVVRLRGVPIGFTPEQVIDARFERLGALFDTMHQTGITHVCFAGGMHRPDLDRAAMDEATAGLMPRLTAAMAGGDDHLLREIIALFEEQGFGVLGAHDIRPDLVAGPGLTIGDVEPSLFDDAARGKAILDALGPLDVGQAVVVAGGHCLGVEALPGTDGLLEFVRDTRRGSGGVLIKRSKPGQDLRIDMPAIGPATIRLAAAAGLKGVAVEDGCVLLLDRDGIIAALDDTGLALWSSP